MRIANIIGDSIVDGPGLRLCIFTQGCPHACPACHNPETHDPTAGQEQSTEALCARILENPLTQGLTISGGEPFLQAADCAILARAAQAAGLSVWVYSGYHYEYLLSQNRPDWQALLEATDVLVDGPYLAAERDLRLLFRGSRNQRLLDLCKTRSTGTLSLWTDESGALPQFTVPES